MHLGHQPRTNRVRDNVTGYHRDVFFAPNGSIVKTSLPKLA